MNEFVREKQHLPNGIITAQRKTDQKCRSIVSFLSDFRGAKSTPPGLPVLRPHCIYAIYARNDITSHPLNYLYREKPANSNRLTTLASVFRLNLRNSI